MGTILIYIVVLVLLVAAVAYSWRGGRPRWQEMLSLALASGLLTVLGFYYARSDSEVRFGVVIGLILTLNFSVRAYTAFKRN